MMIGIGAGISNPRPAGGAWWPHGAAFAADLIAGRFMRGGLSAARSEALSFARASQGWARNTAGAILLFNENEMRITDRGLVLEGARTRLSPAPLGIGASPWANFGVPSFSILPADGAFPAPCRIWSPTGASWERRVTANIALQDGQAVHAKVRYRAGTSLNLGLYMRPEFSGALSSMLAGPTGNVTPQNAPVGTWANVINTHIGGGLYEVEADFIPNQTENYRFGVSANSTIANFYVDVLGAMVVGGSGPAEWIFGNPGGTFLRQADQLTLHLPAGEHDLKFRFADGTTQIFSGLSASHTIDAAEIARPQIASIFSV